MQGEAIAQNLRPMFGLKVPIISVVTGEGGSGGALAIGCANKLVGKIRVSFPQINKCYYLCKIVTFSGNIRQNTDTK